MKQVLIDTNVVLDALLHRDGFFDMAIDLFRRMRQENCIGYVASTTITNIYYIVRKQDGRAIAEEAVKLTLDRFEVIPVDDAVLRSAWHLRRQDFEDAVQAAAAKAVGIDVVVTRDKVGFADSGLAVFGPEEFAGVFERGI